MIQYLIENELFPSDPFKKGFFPQYTDTIGLNTSNATREFCQEMEEIRWMESPHFERVTENLAHRPRNSHEWNMVYSLDPNCPLPNRKSISKRVRFEESLYKSNPKLPCIVRMPLRMIGGRRYLNFSLIFNLKFPPTPFTNKIKA